mgnify:CR=1 FL=1
MKVDMAFSSQIEECVPCKSCQEKPSFEIQYKSGYISEPSEEFPDGLDVPPRMCLGIGCGVSTETCWRHGVETRWEETDEQDLSKKNQLLSKMADLSVKWWNKKHTSED